NRRGHECSALQDESVAGRYQHIVIGQVGYPEPKRSFQRFEHRRCFPHGEAAADAYSCDFGLRELDAGPRVTTDLTDYFLEGVAGEYQHALGPSQPSLYLRALDAADVAQELGRVRLLAHRVQDRRNLAGVQCAQLSR